MRKLVLVAVVAGGVAWWMGWRPSWDVRTWVSDRTGCEPSYPDVCISPPPPLFRCRDLEVASFKVFGSYPHRFDPDGDGIGCAPGDP